MPTLETTFSETLTLAPVLVLLLFDRFTEENRLVGLYAEPSEEAEDEARARVYGDDRRLRQHTTVRVAGRSVVPFRRAPDASFVFVGLGPGPHTIQIRSPYYQARDVVIPVPTSPLWPAFPDVLLANEDLPLGDPAQPAAYRLQRATATLQPSATYPFPPGGTLVRGTVRSGGAALENARVVAAGQEYLTGEDGQFVFAFPKISVTGQTITLDVTHPLHPAVSQNVTSMRGVMVIQNITMA